MKTKIFRKINIEKIYEFNYNDVIFYEFHLNKPIEIVKEFNNKISTNLYKTFVINYVQLKDIISKFDNINNFKDFINKEVDIKIYYFFKNDKVIIKNKEIICEHSGCYIDIIKIYRKYENS